MSIYEQASVKGKKIESGLTQASIRRRHPAARHTTVFEPAPFMAAESSGRFRSDVPCHQHGVRLIVIRFH